MENWITTKEASELTGYNEEYIRRLLRFQKIRGQKFGTTWQVDRTSLLDYLQETERRGPRDSSQTSENML
ncbi:MAG: hypothetical protein Fur0022_02620 [Anaerolineales bacterium]